MAVKPTPFRMNSNAAQRIIRELAADSENVTVLPHASQQMRKRGISLPQVLACLRNGRIIEGPALDIKGFWRSTLYWRIAGDDINVVCSISQDVNTRKNVLVVTAF